MKKFILSLIALLSIVTILFADTWVNGYTKKDGTSVVGHYRSDVNNTVQDNWSYKGNVNPYTGKVGSNYYRNNSSSEYYENNNTNQSETRYWETTEVASNGTICIKTYSSRSVPYIKVVYISYYTLSSGEQRIKKSRWKWDEDTGELIKCDTTVFDMNNNLLDYTNYLNN